MKLSPDNFSTYTLNKRFTFQGEHFDTPYTRYTYETPNALYDVDIRHSDSDRTYHVNSGFDTVQHPIHVQIEKHYNLA